MARKKAAKKRTRKNARRGETAKRAKVGSPTVVQLRFANEGSPMAKKKSGHHGKKRAHGRKHNPANPKHRARRRRNPGVTFVQALGKVLGAAAAMFGTGVVTTYAVTKIAQGNPLSLYGIPAGFVLLGAGVATKMPMVGAGIAAGAAAPFVLPVTSSLMSPPAATPTTTGAALKAVAMGGTWRELSQYPRPAGIGAVQMGSVHAG